MKKSSLPLLLFICILFGCSKFTAFQDEALKFAEDKQVTKEEYLALEQFIQTSDDKAFAQFRDAAGKADTVKLTNYLLRLCRAKNITIGREAIWHDAPAQASSGKFNINVYLENSGSMDGYMNDPYTSFKNGVYSLLTRLKLLSDPDSLNLFLVNAKDQLLYPNASETDIDKFKKILEPSAFEKISSGLTGSTDLNDLIKRCLSKTDEHNLSVFISDCIYSPGKSVPDAGKYLADQKQGIFLHFATQLRQRDISILLLQMKASFQGTYYDKYNNTIHLDKPVSRPYYIWFIGTPEQIREVLSSRKLDEIDGGYQNKLLINTIRQAQLPPYKILLGEKTGDFNLPEDAHGPISGATASKQSATSGLFGFKVAVDFSSTLQTDQYFSDAGNYELSNKNYSLNVAPIGPNPDISLAGFTHILSFQTKNLSNETLAINLVGKVPQWINDCTSEDDKNIGRDTSEYSKTFGLKYLVEGICDAFYPKSQENSIANVNVTIKK